MKKRILSLVLAFAMAATLAPAMAGTESKAAVKAGERFMYKPDAAWVNLGEKTANAYDQDSLDNLDFKLEAKTPEGRIRTSGDLQVGDVISIKLNEDSSLTDLVIMSNDGKSRYNASLDDVYIQWVRTTDDGVGAAGKWEVIDGADGKTYTVGAGDIDEEISCVLWIPEADYDSSDVDSAINNIDNLELALQRSTKLDSVSYSAVGDNATTEDVSIKVGSTYENTKRDGNLDGTFVSKDNIAVIRSNIVSTAAANAAEPTFKETGSKISRSASYVIGVRAATIGASSEVNKGELSGKMFDVLSAKSANGDSLLRVGNTFVVASNDVSVAAGLADIEMTFGASADYKASDVWKNGISDTVRGNGDPIRWGISRQQNTTKGTSTSPGAALNNDGFVQDRGALTAGVYDIYVNTRADGALYESDTVKTNYNLLVISGSGSTINLVLDLNGGDLPGVNYGFAQANVYNSETEKTTKIATRTIGFNSRENGNDNSRMYDLPVLPKKGEEFFQGWATKADSKETLTSTSNLESRYDTQYWAVFGDTEVKTDVPVGGQTVYRLLNPANGEHLYTAEVSEVKALTAQGWVEEKNDFYGQATGGIIVRRIYNPATGEHLYVENNSNEMNVLCGRYGWLAEGVVFRSADAGTAKTAMYRMYNPKNPAASQHLYTTDANEYSYLSSHGWTPEGVKFFGVK